MIKFKQGGIGDLEGNNKDIIVRAVAPNSLKDVLIGGGLVLMGITYLTYTAFRHGSKAFEIAEYNTMEELGLV